MPGWQRFHRGVGLRTSHDARAHAHARSFPSPSPAPRCVTDPRAVGAGTSFVLLSIWLHEHTTVCWPGGQSFGLNKFKMSTDARVCVWGTCISLGLTAHSGTAKDEADAGVTPSGTAHAAPKWHFFGLSLHFPVTNEPLPCVYLPSL